MVAEALGNVIMSTITDAVFFLKGEKIVKEMLVSEFEALLDGIVEASEFKGQQGVHAVQVQITENLKIKGLIFFLIGFTSEGQVESDWNVPFNQLLQSSGRGPDLGAGKVHLVCKSQCSVPWHQNKLWDPEQSIIQLLVSTVQNNRLGIAESEDAGDWDIPTLTAEPPILTPVTAEPPLLTPAASEIPTLQAAPVETIAADKPTPAVDSDELNLLRMELTAIKAASSVKLDKLQKDYDELLARSKENIASLKQQAKEHVTQIAVDSKADMAIKDQQVQALKDQIESEQNRYTKLKEQQVEQAAESHLEREELLEQLQNGQDVEGDKIEALKQAFKNELSASVEAETAKTNEMLAMREVELFYRDEQITLLAADVAKLKDEKQLLMTESGSHILKALEDSGVTFVAFHVGVGHITIALEEVGRYLDQRTAFLAERCNVSIDVFNSWNEHYQQPICRHVDVSGKVCGQVIEKIELVSQFEAGISDHCEQHK